MFLQQTRRQKVLDRNLPSITSSGSSVGIVLSRTKATE
jgi:hypothetical protein